MNHLDHIEEIAVEASKLYGQDWKEIYGFPRDIWRNTVRETPRGGGSSPAELCAGQAIEAWYQAQADKENPLIEKPKTKKVR